MKVTLEIDGERSEVEVDLDGKTATIGGRSFAAVVVATGPSRIELEIGGERVVVEGWYHGVTSPADPVTVAGELHRVSAEVSAGSRRAEPTAARPTGPPSPPSVGTPPAVPASTGGGTPVLPPMPGKVVELRVSEGDHVGSGQVLLVLEAMKMRNEVASPATGRVAELRVQAGSNVRAREPMLRIVAD